MKKIKVWIAVVGLVLVLATTVLPTQCLADQADPQGLTQPAPPPPPPPPPPDLLALLLKLLGLA